MKKLLDEMKETSDQAEIVRAAAIEEALRHPARGEHGQHRPSAGDHGRVAATRSAAPGPASRAAGRPGNRPASQRGRGGGASVLGDDAESLRLARQQLDELIRQANGQDRGTTIRGQRPEDGRQRSDNRGQQAQDSQQRTQDGQQAAENGTERPPGRLPRNRIRNPQSAIEQVWASTPARRLTPRRRTAARRRVPAGPG